MGVTVARNAGFCWGVRRALDSVLEELKRGPGPFVVFGPLVHNPQVLAALRERGVEVWEGGADKAPDAGVLFLRTHGVSAEEMERLSKLPVRLRNLTCPRVARAQGLARKYSHSDRDIVILGDPDHAEVIALLSYSGDRAHLVTGQSDLGNLEGLHRPVLLSQTTQNRKLFERVSAILREEYPDLLVEDTICDSTDSRQDELRRLCPKADCVVVVGGSRSANTARLTSIAGEEGSAAFQVETAEDLPEQELSRFRKVLVTAGASTPSWSIRRVRERLLEIQGRTRPVGTLLGLLRAAFFSSLYIVPAALALGAASGVALEGSPWWLASIPASLTIFALHNLNAIVEVAQPRFTSLGRDAYVRRNRSWLLKLAILMVPISLIIAGLMGLVFLLGYLGVWLLFGAYSLPLLKRGQFISSWLRALPGSRDLLFAGAWSLLLSVLPFVGLGGSLGDGSMWIWSAALFMLLMARSLMLDLLDIQGDAFVGRETLPTLLGTATGRSLLHLCLLLATILPIAGSVLLDLEAAAAVFSVAPLALVAVSIWLRMQRFPSEVTVRLFVDGGLLLAGLAPLVLWLSSRVR